MCFEVNHVEHVYLSEIRLAPEEVMIRIGAIKPELNVQRFSHEIMLYTQVWSPGIG